MGIIAWLLIGAIAGWLADQVIGGGRIGLFGDVVLGIIGALVGGWVAGRFFGVQNAISGFTPMTFVVAFLGAALVLVIANALS